MHNISWDVRTQASLHTENGKSYSKFHRKYKVYKDKENSTENVKNQNKTSFLSPNIRSSRKKKKKRIKKWRRDGKRNYQRNKSGKYPTPERHELLN